MEALTLAALVALAWKVIEVLKGVSAWALPRALAADGVSSKDARQRRAAGLDVVLTQTVGWVAGIVVVFLAKAASVTHDIAVWDTTIGRLDGWSAVLLGLMLASSAGVGYEAKKAVDRNDSARQPSMTMAGEAASPSGRPAAGPVIELAVLEQLDRIAYRMEHLAPGSSGAAERPHARPNATHY